MQIESTTLPLSKLVYNRGQIKGVPKNPRKINEVKLQQLRDSLLENPEMLELRELIVIPFEKKYVVLAGNMRLRAMRDLGNKETNVKIIPADTPVDQIKAYIIKDNVSYGDHDWELIQHEWDIPTLEDWGLEVVRLEPEGLHDDLNNDQQHNQQPIITVTFKDNSQLQKAETAIREIIEGHFPDSNISINLAE